MTNSYTYINAIDEALSYELSTQCRDKLTALRAQIEKRNTTHSDKPTKKQVENADVKDAILSKLSSTEGKRCGDIATAVGISGQKCSALLSQLVKTGEVIKTEEKRVALFTLPIGG